VGKPVILGAVRTAGGKFGGSLKALTAPELGALILRSAVERSRINPADVAEVIMGNGWQAGAGPNPARIAVWKSGVLADVPAYSVNIRCGSGLKAVMLAADRIRLGDIKAGIAGGMESTSNVPYLLPEARWGHTLGEKKTPDALHKDGFFCPLAEMMMGETAEILADEYGISRREQENYTLESHRRAIEAIDSGYFHDEIVPVTVRQKKEEITFSVDEIPRRGTGPEKLAKLPPVFRKDGTVTAGTSSALCDAASALVVADEEWAAAEGYSPVAEILGYATATVRPDHMGLGPVASTPPALEQAGVSLQDIDYIELNEAFAVQVLAVAREMDIDLSACNIHGGAVSLGHPIGATGAKLLTTLTSILRRRKRELGLVTACVGGGQGVSMVIRARG
jgi:acetyl-CoA C-acetyltransferase